MRSVREIFSSCFRTKQPETEKPVPSRPVETRTEPEKAVSTPTNNVQSPEPISTGDTARSDPPVTPSPIRAVNTTTVMPKPKPKPKPKPTPKPASSGAPRSTGGSGGGGTGGYGDFGATSSAAAFALPYPTTQANNDIRVLNKWPESTRWSYDKLPRPHQVQSTVYYNQYHTVVGWGDKTHEAITPRHSPAPGVYMVSDFKSQLSPLGDGGSMYYNNPFLQDRCAADIAADYLWHLRKSACSQIAEDLSAECTTQSRVNFRYVMTVPAYWDENARAEFRAVAKRSGLGIHSPDESVLLVPGPEVAVLYAGCTNQSAFQVGDVVLVLDCGGHIVECVGYEIKSTDPCTVEKVGGGAAASCGSALVTRRFMSIVEDKARTLERLGFNVARSRLRAKCRADFERRIKLEFGKSSDGQQPLIPLDLPRGAWAVDVGWELDVPEVGLEEGYLVFSEEEMEACFDAAVDRTRELVDGQIGELREQGRRVQSCVLVGGFNKCMYFSEKVDSHVASCGLQLIKPDPLLSAVKGAVLTGLRDVSRR
ncbi:hypothetical protein FE257_000150 [Aspergillus nanangensis]|uniref:Actin-like ATPase domain-containing protein n=1 Tax=Aspergillus nanangensis TaxID=2582783 RepID=A0AAD4D0L7_ASPNN|nr:hypothetical protein FE257_000150 [Aspergillus nanangensis]